MKTIVKIISVQQITHDVKQFRIEKPAGYTYSPGQATELSINEPGWSHKRNPFTFTSLTNAPFLEFVIKIYPEHNGVTNHLSMLVAGDELILHEAWGAIEYKGPGYFIAGGAGITPMIAIFKSLKQQGKVEDNTLFYSNKTDKDIILIDELESILGKNALFTITRQNDSKFDQRRIDEAFLKAEVKDFSKHFYICGPDAMVAAISNTLEKLGAKADTLIFEK